VDDVDPIMVYQEDGSRKWLQKFGNARVSYSGHRDSPLYEVVFLTVKIVARGQIPWQGVGCYGVRQLAHHRFIPARG
jgi:hypothetical protein